MPACHDRLWGDAHVTARCASVRLSVAAVCNEGASE
jgi:hypothetical protein